MDGVADCIEPQEEDHENAVSSSHAVETDRGSASMQEFITLLQPKRKRTNKDNLRAEAANWRLNRERFIAAYRNRSQEHACNSSCRRISRSQVKCVDLSSFETKSLVHCQAVSLAQQLITSGYFPSTPERPSIAFSINTLRLFQAVQEHGKCSKDAFANGILLFHEQLHLKELLSVQMRHHFSEYFHDAHAHWLTIDAASRDKCYADLNTLHRKSTVENSIHESSKFGVADLHEMCPACFGWTASETDGSEYPALILCLDGNMQHKRFKQKEVTPWAAVCFYLS